MLTLNADKTRRRSSQAVLLSVLGMVCVSIVLNSDVRAQGDTGHDHAGPSSTIKDVPEAELNAPGELPEIVLGNADAKITIIEYASMTCSHCGQFHRKLLPEIKKKYIDTGIARLFVREFPLENVAAAASMFARCTGPTKTYNAIAMMFDRQQQWLVGDDVREGLLAIAKEFGLTEKQFDDCLEDKALLQKIANMRSRAHKVFGVKSTPTFFINGKGLVGPRSIEDFDKIIQPMLPK